jgi:hypothetical protein
VEKLGKPGVLVTTDQFHNDAQLAAEDVGMPKLRMVALPAREWYRARIDARMSGDLAEKYFDQVVDALTRPLSQEEANPKPRVKEVLEPWFDVIAKDQDMVPDAVTQLFMEKHMNDGLPVVPPTKDAVDWMLAGTSRSPDEKIGTLPPRRGTATIRKIAINAVMAGARPEYLPVIIAAVEGLADPNFDGTWWRMSTSSSFPAIIVSGPLGAELKMNSGMGLIGYGFRANATIGRAVQLVTLNMGQTWPDVNDMAGTGRTNSYTFWVFAEDPESPWESYAVGKGYKSEETVVITTVAGSGTMRTIGGGAVAPWTEKGILDGVVQQIGRIGGSVWTATWTLVMHPECARLLKTDGMSRKDVQNFLWEESKVPYEKIAQSSIKAINESLDAGHFLPESAPVFREALKPGGKVPVVQTPEHIDIVVAGGMAGYTWLFGGMGANPHHSVKKVTGATLTKSGRGA